MPRVRLGELLLSRGACTREALAAAWEQQVLFGDRLGTNLLAVHALDEATLAAALGAQHGVHHGSGDVLRVDERVVPLVPRTLCLSRRVLPHHVVDRTLYLLMADPTDLRTIDEVRFASRLKVQPIVVCEARMWALLSTWLGESPSLRPNPLAAPWRPRPAAASTTPSTEGAPVDDLVSEDEFNALYARTGQAGGAAALIDADGAPPAPAAPPVAELPTWNNAVTRPMRLPLVPGQPASSQPSPPTPELLAPPRVRPATLPGLSVPTSTAPTSAPVPTLEQAQEWQRSLEHTAPILARPGLSGAEVIELVEVVDFDPETIPPDAPIFVTPSTPAPAPAPDHAPLSFDEATRLLASAKDRNDIAAIVLRAARARFARAALLMVHPHAFVGWQGLGEGFEDIARVSVPRDVPSVFSLVATSNAHYLGPLQRQAAHGAWVKATGKRIPRSIVVLPILVRGRTVSLLVADNGHDQHVDGDVGELLILSRHIAASWENLLARWA